MVDYGKMHGGIRCADNTNNNKPCKQSGDGTTSYPKQRTVRVRRAPMLVVVQVKVVGGA